MKGMPLSFDFEGKGVLDLDLILKNRGFFWVDLLSSSERNCYGFGEPTSVLDTVRTRSRPTSSSTLSSSLGGGGGSTGHGGGGAASTDTAGVVAVSDANRTSKWHQDSTTATSSNVGGTDSGLFPIPSSVNVGVSVAGNPEKFAMDDWESVLSESAAVSPIQDPSILRWIIGSDVEEKNPLPMAPTGCGIPAPEFDFSGVDQDLGASFIPTLPIFSNNNYNSGSGSEKINFIFPLNSQAIVHHPSNNPAPIFNSGLMMNHHSENPSFFFPLPSYPQQQEQSMYSPPQPKRQNSGGLLDSGGTQISKTSLMDTPNQLQFVPYYLQQRSLSSEDLEHCHHQQHQSMVDELYKAAELVQTGNLVLAHGILARLNHLLSPIGSPLQRAAFYCKEALQLLLHPSATTAPSSPFSLIFKIGAYKSFSEISPLVQFTNFTCNQAILEAMEGFDRIHIVDFDIGYGGQWASLMQELALRTNGPPSVKITAVASLSSTHDQLEIGLTRENLIQFASEVNIPFEFEVMSIDSLSCGNWLVKENEGVAVNLPLGSSYYQFSMPWVLRFVKQLSLRILVSVDRGYDRTDLSFANHVIHALQSYSNLLESLDAVNIHVEALQRIERFLLQPGIEKTVMARFRAPEKTQHWRSMLLSSGFSPVAFSNFTESQAECVTKRTPVRGFGVEKKQSSLVLCWQRKELVSASAWRCC